MQIKQITSNSSDLNQHICNVLDLAYEVGDDVDRPTIDKAILDYYFITLYDEQKLVGVIIFTTFDGVTEIISLFSEKGREAEIYPRLFYTIDEDSTDSIILYVKETEVTKQIVVRDVLHLKCTDEVKDDGENFYYFEKIIRQPIFAP